MLLHKSVEFDSRVRREAAALAGAGHEVVVLELADVAPAAAMLDGFTRRSVGSTAGMRSRLPSALYRIAMVRRFVRGIRAVGPDAVHAHDAAMLLPGAIGSRLTGAMLVYDSHELAVGVPYRESGWAWLVSTIERLIVPRCAAVITVSDGIAARLRDLYGLAVTPTVVRNVTALERNGAGGLRRTLGIGADVSLVLHQGASAPARGCAQLIEAAATLGDVHVAFLGDPEPGYKERLAALIAARGLGDRVVVLPSVPLAELLSWTAEADIGVTLLEDNCENHRLALPNKLFEYIAAGVPVIASALPEVERLVTSYGIGWCVTPDDADALGEALRIAIGARDDPGLRERIARAGQELRWSSERMRLLELYDRLALVS